MRVVFVALVAVLWPSVGLCAEPRPAPTAKKPKPALTAKKPKTAAEEREAERKISELLKTKKVSFDFVETPVQDALAFLQQLMGVNLIVDPMIDKHMPLTLRVNDMRVGQALQWIARLAGGKMDVRDGAVVILAAKDAERVFGPKGKHEKMLLKADRFRKPGQPLGKVTMPLGNGGTLELALVDDDLGREIRSLVLRMLHHRLLTELAKQDPEAAAQLREIMEDRQRRAREFQEERAREKAEMLRRRALEKAREAAERRQKAKPGEGDKKGQF